MSWGERSCQKPCRIPDKCTRKTCNIEYPEYIWDGKTKPDSVTKEYQELVENTDTYSYNGNKFVSTDRLVQSMKQKEVELLAEELIVENISNRNIKRLQRKKKKDLFSKYF